MTMIELENERLHKELMLLQEQNFLTQNRRKSDREGRDNKYKGHGYSDHRGEAHSYYKHLNCDKLENISYSSKPKVYGKNVTKGSDITENDFVGNTLVFVFCPVIELKSNGGTTTGLVLTYSSSIL
jgi:hypothetical protein